MPNTEFPEHELPQNIADFDKLENTPPKPHRPAEGYPKAVESTPPLRDADMEWVEASLAAMTIEQKVGQLFISIGTQPGVAEAQIDNHHIGGFIFMGNGQRAADIVARTNQLQAYSPFPLWFAIDSEAGLGARVADATIFPLLMAFGASGDSNMAELCGRITARESRALGLHMTFGPVVDVNTEPINPIISTRSYSDRPELASFMARGYIAGARAEGVLATFKHYPGHGASQGDSHSSLPTIDLSLAELEEKHIRPYRNLAGSGDVDLVMTAHIWFSQVHPGTPWPATLSSIFNQDILRDSIGYQGLIISDAYDMAGLTIAIPSAAERGIIGIESGLDIILGDAPSAQAQTWQGIVDAVKSGRITEERLNESVRRVLTAKSRARLPESTQVDPNLWSTILDHPEHRAIVRRLSEKAFTRVFDRIGGESVIRSTDRVLVVTLAASQRIFYRFGTETFNARLSALAPNAQFLSASRPVSTSERNAILAAAANVDRVIVVGTDWTKINTASQIELINALAAAPTPVVYLGFGAPYHIQAIPGVDAFYCGYSTVPEMQEVAAEVLTGQRSAEGRLPVAFDDIAAPPLLTGIMAN